MSELGYLRSQNREIIPLTSKIITIGKDPGCDIVISHTRVALRHACITFESANNANLRIYDANLYTAVNGEPIKSVDRKINLLQGDVLSFGNEFVKYVFTYPETKRRNLSANVPTGSASQKVEGGRQPLQPQKENVAAARLNTSSLETLTIDKYQDPKNIRNIYFPSPIHRLSTDENLTKKTSHNVEKVPQKSVKRKLKLSSLTPEDYQQNIYLQQQQQLQKKHFSSVWEAVPQYDRSDHEKNSPLKGTDKKASSRVNLSLLEDEEIDELRRESNFLELVKKVLEKEAVIIKKEDDIERLENEKKSLLEETQKKEERIAQLEEYSGNLRRNIELVERELYDKTMKLESLESGSKSQQELFELRNQSAAKDERISQLLRELNEKTIKSEDKGSESAMRLKQELFELRTQTAAKTEQISQLQRELSVRSENMESATRLRQELFELRNQSAAKDEQISQLQRELSVRSENMESATRLKQELFELKNQSAAKDERISQLQKELHEKTAKLENMESASKSNELLELKNLLAARDEQINQLQKELNESQIKYTEKVPNNTINQSFPQNTAQESATFNQRSPPKTETERKSVEPSAEEKLEDMRLLLEKQAETFQAIIVEQDRRVNEIYLSYLKLLGETKEGREIDNRKAFEEVMKHITSLQKERMALAEEKMRIASENNELKHQMRLSKIDDPSFIGDRKSATPHTPEISNDMSFNLSVIKPTATPPKQNRPPVSFHKYNLDEQPKSLVHRIQELEEKLREESLKSAKLQQMLELQQSTMNNREIQLKKGYELLSQRDQEYKHLKEKYDALMRQMKAVHETIIQSIPTPKKLD